MLEIIFAIGIFLIILFITRTSFLHNEHKEIQRRVEKLEINKKV
jgi:hypothetical protein